MERGRSRNRERRARLCEFPFNPFFSPHTPSPAGERISQANALLCDCRKGSQLFIPSNSSFFSGSPSSADCSKKTRGEGKTVKIILETFVGEKEGRTRNFILYFILPQESRKYRKGKTFESSRRPKA